METDVCLNNMTCARRGKHKMPPLLGSQRFDTVAIVIRGIELAAKIGKHQFKIGRQPGKPQTTSEMWVALQLREVGHPSLLAN